MGFTEQGINISIPASGDLSSSQYLFVDATSGKATVVSVSGAKALGVLQDKPAAADRAACVQILGTTKVKAGAAVTIGADIMSNGSGQAITATTGKVSKGIALEAATAAGDIIAVALHGGNGTVA